MNFQANVYGAAPPDAAATKVHVTLPVAGATQGRFWTLIEPVSGTGCDCLRVRTKSTRASPLIATVLAASSYPVADAVSVKLPLAMEPIE